ncbi:MAG: hypothetical protein LV479_08530 [Methylacidiphilales bacterium]|nr:hypothetical protein [Candidatus Methylacidiphilales bacterium]
MVRAVKTKATRSLHKGERAVLLPGATSAEPWEVWVLGGQAEPQCIQACSSPNDNRLSKQTTLALPVSQVYCLPLWLNETDPKQFGQMIPLQLELRGLQPRNGVAVADWSVAATEENRTLVTVGVLPATEDPELHVEAYRRFDLSARYLELPENAITVWREQDQLVVAFTRDNHLVYFQALGDEHITPRVLQDLTCLRATLIMQGILTNLRQIVLWVDATPAEVESLRATLQLSVTVPQKPPPRAPSPVWKLTPGTVSEAQRQQEVWRWRRRGIFLGLAAYLLIAGFLLIRFYFLSQQGDALRKWQSAHAATLAQIHATQAAWNALRPVVDESGYPLEILRATNEAIPADDLHLTLFEADDSHLLIKGEAKNAPAAFQFLDKLQNDNRFAGYHWERSQPTLAANDLTQFQIEGTRAP